MSKLQLKLDRVKTPGGHEVAHLALTGIINAQTLLDLQKRIKEVVQSDHDYIFDMAGITYINSSGLGELVRVHDMLDQRNHRLLLCGMDEDVTRLVGMLGLLSILHVFPTRAAAMSVVDSGFAGLAEKAEKAVIKPKQRGAAFVPVVSAPKPKLPEARILLGMKSDDPFAHFIARCLAGNDGDVVTVSSRQDARKAMQARGVDIAILEYALDDYAAICADLKIRPENKLVSIIGIYQSEEERDDYSTLRVLEDESVAEPFEVRELIAMATGEYARCRSEAMLFEKETHFKLPTRDADINLVSEMLETMINASPLSREAATSFFYAVREAVDNARRHGHKAKDSAVIDVLYLRDKEKLTVTVEDEGPGFDYKAVLEKAQEMKPADAARERQQQGGYGGIGIGLMLRCCDKVAYRPPGNHLTLTKYF